MVEKNVLKHFSDILLLSIANELKWLNFTELAEKNYDICTILTSVWPEYWLVPLITFKYQEWESLPAHFISHVSPSHRQGFQTSRC